ncbi:MAG: cystathionine gamma-synthase family protein [Variovorax sp.]
MTPDDPNTPDPTTRLVHADRRFGVEQGGVHMPIHNSVQYGYERVEDLIGVFQGTLKGRFNYARQGTPTTAALESKITQLEGGVGTVCFATGMAAATAVLFTLLRAGDHLVASRFLFGNTISLLGTLQGLGVQVTLVDAGNAQAVADALTPATRMVWVETIANPGTQVPDLAGIGALCREHALVYAIDNTITSPALFRPKSVGASLSINSLTKTVAGHGNALGGAVTDTGLFDWTRCTSIFDGYRQGDPKQWGLTQLRKKALRDMGGTLSSDAAHRIAVGAETLALRVAQTSATALALATFLESHPAVARVHYPMLASHAQHAIAKAHFSAGSWLMSFELRNADDCIAMLNRLRLPIKATGMGDTRTLVIPMAPTIFFEVGKARRAELGIAEGLIRVSVGLERASDLVADFDQALA